MRPTPTSRSKLGAKLNAPAVDSSQVLRRRVGARMEAATNARLTLIHAPAGFGKTTAMLQFRAGLEERGIATAWLTLDAGDNDVSRLLDGLDAATSVLARQAGGPEPARRESGDASRDLATQALGIFDRLSSRVEPFVLFLDDFELVQTPAASELVREIIENLPRCGHLVIGSRGVPDIGLGRLRAHGQLLEVDVDCLRFSVEETVEFFANRGLANLASDELALLHQKTDGWVAALRLASVALDQQQDRARFIDDFSGSQGALAEYLAQDVLARQTEEVRHFLLCTSVLRHLSPPLCDALLPGIDSGAMLRQLESAHVFLSPMEGDEKTYRYHSLFADFLQAELSRRSPKEKARLHRAAADWYEAQRRPVPAIDHAIASRDFDHAVALLSRHVMPLLSEGRLRLLSRWFAALPGGLVDREPMLQVAEVWAAIGTSGPRKGMELLLRSGLEAAQTTEQVRPYVRVLRPFLLAAMDRYEEAGRLGREALSQVPSSAPLADALLENKMAAVFSVLGDAHEATGLLEAARRTQGQAPSALNLMYSETVAAINNLREGRLREAHANFRVAAGAKGTSWSGILHAELLYERNELRHAFQLLKVYVPLIRDMAAPDQMILGNVLLSRIAFDRGDVDQAFEHLTELEYIGHQRQLARVVATSKLERARLRLLQGYAEAARAELERADDVEVWKMVGRLRLPANDVEDMVVGRLRWTALVGKPQDALRALEQAIAAAQTGARYRRALKLRLLHGIALQRSGNLPSACAAMEQVLDVACREGYVRIILDEGLAAGRLLKEYAAASVSGAQVPRRPASAECVQSLLDAFGTTLADVEAPAARRGDELSGMQEALTRSETKVLQLLAEGYSNSAMMEKLFVSDSTVRTHLRNINAKLAASNRTQAVAIARRLGLIV
jgi:LuxR family transcriptional regulator, maltose regulon positive regulatory protein